MHTVARIITRLQGENDGMFLGVTLESGKDAFKPNTVYEIRDMLGTLTIVEVGQGIGKGPDNGAPVDQGAFHWATDIGHIIAEYGSSMFYTLEEYQNRIAFFREQNKDLVD